MAVCPHSKGKERDEDRPALPRQKMAIVILSASQFPNKHHFTSVAFFNIANMAAISKYLSGDSSAISDFIDRFDVR